MDRVVPRPEVTVQEVARASTLDCFGDQAMTFRAGVFHFYDLFRTSHNRMRRILDQRSAIRRGIIPRL